MKYKLWLLFAGLILCFCAMTTAAQAQASRTWVSGVGDDANPCSRTAPCKTFAGAISKTAECGEIDALDPAGFGAVTITKGIKIDGGGGESGQVASVLVSGTNGIVINVQSQTCTFVVLRNLDVQGINSGLNGINALAGGQVSLEHVDVENFTQNCVNFQPTGAMSLVAYDSNFERCATGGLNISSQTAVRATIEKSTIQRASASGRGIQVGANASVSVHNSMIAGNLGGGAEANGSTARLQLDLCNVSNNLGNGVHATNSGIVLMSNTAVAYNSGFGILADTGGQILTGNNNWLGGNGTDGVRTGALTVQ